MATNCFIGTKTKFVYHMFVDYQQFVKDTFSFIKIQFYRASPTRLSAHITVWARVPEHLARSSVRMGGRRSFAADTMVMAGVRTSDVGCVSISLAALQQYQALH